MPHDPTERAPHIAPGQAADALATAQPPPRARWVRLLLLPPFVAMLWVPSYNTTEPAWLGLPFFYWYQLLWIPLSAVLIGIVYRAEH